MVSDNVESTAVSAKLDLFAYSRLAESNANNGRFYLVQVATINERNSLGSELKAAERRTRQNPPRPRNQFNRSLRFVLSAIR